MSEESITDIIADLRNDNIPRLSGEDMIRCLLHNTADRLDAAVKRIKKILADARCDIAVLDQLEYATTGEVAAPGNAAALREALEKAKLYFDHRGEGTNFDDAGMAIDAITSIDAALAAPARNCDRPECADVESAWATYCAETNRADCREFARWLFATAEKGGDNA